MVCWGMQVPNPSCSSFSSLLSQSKGRLQQCLRDRESGPDGGEEAESLTHTHTETYTHTELGTQETRGVLTEQRTNRMSTKARTL